MTKLPFAGSIKTGLLATGCFTMLAAITAADLAHRIAYAWPR